MTGNIFDCGVIGLGVAGAFCIYKLASQNKDMKILAIEAGRPWLKRRQQMFGFLGCLTTSDGKFFTNNINDVANIVGLRKAKSANTYFNNVLNQIDDFKITKDHSLSISLEKRIKKQGYTVSLNDYTQIYPKQIHMLSKQMADVLENNSNITFSFDNEAMRIVKQKGTFIITTEEQEYRCKKLIIAVGRAGWRWANELYNSLGIIEDNDIARFGIRVEANSSIFKDFNKSNCSIFKGDDLEIGPMSWYGTVIPEDHTDMAISAFRSNEVRWKTDKVSFQFIGNRPFPSNGFEQADRLAKLTFLIANDRIVKERVSSIISGRSKLSMMHEYDWLKESILDFAKIIPEITTKAYFHLPTIIPLCSQINIGKNLETDIDGMYVAGESAGIRGLLAAGLTGLIVADEVCK
jgi:uncharacterized FAD-dependent dehydrogenase